MEHRATYPTRGPSGIGPPTTALHKQKYYIILYYTILYYTEVHALVDSTLFRAPGRRIPSALSLFQPTLPTHHTPIKPKPQTPASHRALPLAYKQGRSPRAKSRAQGAHAARDEPRCQGCYSADYWLWPGQVGAAGKGKKVSRSFLGVGGPW